MSRRHPHACHVRVRLGSIFTCSVSKWFIDVVAAILMRVDYALAALVHATAALTSDTFSLSRSILVDQHNTKRRASPPLPAADMLEMTWDADLAAKAMTVSQTCVFAHSVDGYGQNLFLSSNGADDTPTVTMALNAWVDSELPASLMTTLVAQGSHIGAGTYNHASQVLWGASNRVGCGYSVCNIGFFMVCNYLAPGNYVGEPWYTVGTACSACPSSAPNCNNGLCSATTASSNNVASPPAKNAPAPPPPPSSAPTTTTPNNSNPTTLTPTVTTTMSLPPAQDSTPPPPTTAPLAKTPSPVPTTTMEGGLAAPSSPATTQPTSHAGRAVVTLSAMGLLLAAIDNFL
ncbi:Aste57867_19422 [Aphanomyces stellatus]|uniref:Aste57867_19422 protein n=1 Tax=Aphanomyces stellatus TaxID=120398 RepID=A0A485LEG4_9STRA|nr:hypothetical protein As57867_019358 [Aphanomyces stellatus]VFT96136.1 Aste57867_19422 [Aphanomyces stellatus]